jgi:hypothetical protein
MRTVRKTLSMRTHLAALIPVFHPRVWPFNPALAITRAREGSAWRNMGEFRFESFSLLNDAKHQFVLP